MDAIDYLVKEHEKAKRMFSKIAEGPHRDDTRRKMFAVLCQDLVVHEKTEHKKLYPHFMNNKKLSNIIKHLKEEENESIKWMNKFKKIKSQQEWDEEFVKFKEHVAHHAVEEETKLFPAVRNILNETELKKMGKEMQAFKKEYAAK